MATPSFPRPASGSTTSIVGTLKSDVQHVAEEIKRRGVWRVLGAPISDLEAFYLTNEDRRLLATMKPFRRLWTRIWWFGRGLLMKLTPARRIMLTAALLFFMIGIQTFGVRTADVARQFRTASTLLLVLVLTLELKDKLVARDELEAGRKVQLALLPTENPAVPGWDVWLYTRPANDVGGDLVDHLAIDSRRHAIALGDVAGKALPAALLSVKLQATLRALAPQFDQLADLGSAVNRIFFRDGLPNRFASLVFLVVTTESGRVRVLNAGHMPPFVVRDRTATAMERGSVVLGIMPDATFSEQSVELGSGDALIVYSDGVSEAMNEAGDFFGDERVQALAQQTPGLSARLTGERVRDAVKAFIGHAPPSDDLSLMVLRRN
jgi:sigma-B regulation protein RsbU (phosphoserine phosphatase)